MKKPAKIRLYVDAALDQGQSVLLSKAQAHYLFSVMRLDIGAPVALFNGKDGEWQAEEVEVGKRKGILQCVAQSQAQLDPSALRAGKLAILFGPEGGFSDAEISRLRNKDTVTTLNPGPRIPRSDTAVIAAMTLWQKPLGDWI